MDIYFAPLEGVTDVIYRRAHHRAFGGIAKYFIPFICPTQHLVLTPKEYNAVSAESNAGIPVVPQILTKNPDHFIWAAGRLADEGHKEVNLNVGCPSGTVTAKGKGAGMLRERDALKQFLDSIFAACPIKISIKTRIGFESPDEWPALLEVFSGYPVHELIVHARTRSEFYSGTPHNDVYGDVSEKTALPLVCNGELFTADECRSMAERFPGATALMLGRGLIANPAVAREFHGGAPIDIDSLRAFHDALYAGYSRDWPKNAILGRMHEIMFYMSTCFEDSAKPRKAIRKSSTLPAYEDAVNRLFSDYRLRDDPGFIPPK